MNAETILSVRMTREQRAFVERAAAAENMTLSGYVRDRLPSFQQNFHVGCHSGITVYGPEEPMVPVSWLVDAFTPRPRWLWRRLFGRL